MIPCDSSVAHIQRLAAIGKDRRWGRLQPHDIF